MASREFAPGTSSDEIRADILRSYLAAAGNAETLTRQEIAAGRGAYKSVTSDGYPTLCLEQCAEHLWRSGASAEEGAGACQAQCCIGCSVAFGLPTGVMFMGYPIKFEAGASSAIVLWGKTHTGKKIFSKFVCIPALRPKSTRAHAPASERETKECIAKMHPKDPLTLTHERFKQLVELSVRKIATDCGLGHLGGDVWVERVKSVFPGVPDNLPVEQTALMMEVADGVSINSLVNTAFSRVKLKTMAEKIDKSLIRDMAVHDLLLSESDRHNGNVFINEEGKLSLIDNDGALGWAPVGDGRGQSQPLPLDSMFVPNTARWNQNVNNKELAWLDYRCHVDGGAIGTNYPPKAAQCMAKIADMEPEALQVNPTPYSLHPTHISHTPHTLHPTLHTPQSPYTLRPTPYTLHPTPLILHPAG